MFDFLFVKISTNFILFLSSKRKQITVWNSTEYIANDSCENFRETFDERTFDLHENVVPVLIQELVHVVSQSFVAIEQIFKVEMHSTIQLKYSIRAVRLLI